MNQQNKILKITKETIVAEILKIPGGEEVLLKHNFPCLDCPMAKFELEKLKIGDVCEIYGIDLEGLLKELNEKLEK